MDWAVLVIARWQSPGRDDDAVRLEPICRTTSGPGSRN